MKDRGKSLMKSIRETVCHAAKRVVSSVFVTALIVAAIYAVLLIVRSVFGVDIAPKKTTVSAVVLEQKLSEVGEIVPYDYEYTDIVKVEDKRTTPFFGIGIPFTTHTIEARYSGRIKVGYYVRDIEVSVNDANQTIFVRLPEVQVLDNYIDQNSLDISQSNNILNPIKADEITTALAGETEKHLQLAEEKGIYMLAENSVKDLIKTLYKDFEYEIIFEQSRTGKTMQGRAGSD